MLNVVRAKHVNYFCCGLSSFFFVLLVRLVINGQAIIAHPTPKITFAAISNGILFGGSSSNISNHP